MRTKGETAGHELAKGNERFMQNAAAQKALHIAKKQEQEKKGKYTWNPQRRAYFLTTNND